MVPSLLTVGNPTPAERNKSVFSDYFEIDQGGIYPPSGFIRAEVAGCQNPRPDWSKIWRQDVDAAT
jgi:hypothetical protein